MINGSSVTSFATTVAVNCNPVEAPTTTVPAGRPQGISRTGAPASDNAVVVNSAPSSHGSGRWAERAAKPPATPAASVPAIASTAAKAFGMGRAVPCIASDASDLGSSREPRRRRW